MKFRAAVVSLAFLVACGGNIPPIGQPTPPPTPKPPAEIPEPQCKEGMNHSCWHFPPDSTMPLYACPVKDANGGVIGVINVTGGPAQCPKDPTPGPTPTPTPPPGGNTNCDGEPGSNTGVKDNAFGDRVNIVVSEETGCSIGSDCPLGDRTQQDFQRAIINRLRAKGICAGQHEPNVTDEIAVSESPTASRRSHHIFAGDDSNGPVPPGGAPRKATWAPGNTREAYNAPKGEPTPEPPPSGGCSVPLPPFVWTAETLPPGWGADEIGNPRWKFGCTIHGKAVDCTPQVAPHACDYCASIGMSPYPDGQLRCGCPVRNECPGFKCEERVACETYLTGGTRLEARNGATCEFYNNNPMQFYPNGGNCRLQSVRDPRVVSDWY